MVNRVLAKIVGQIGSSPWSINEINGRLLQFKIACLGGLSIVKRNDLYIITLVLTVSKYLNKYTSTFETTDNISEGVKRCFKETLCVFNKS
jgi:hypothetical protein